MSVLLILLFLALAYVTYKFFSWKSSVEKNIEGRGGIKSVYSGFVGKLEEKGLEIKELTPNSAYLHYGNKYGKIGAQLVVTGPEKAEVTMGEETPAGDEHKVQNVISSGSSYEQSRVAEKMLSRMPSRDVILPHTDTDEREKKGSGSSRKKDDSTNSAVHQLEKKVEKMTRSRKIRALHEAAEDGKTDVMRAVLATGVDPDAEVGSTISGLGGEDSDNPLHIAAESGEMSAVEILLDAGADVNAAGLADETPLHHAAAGGHTDIVETLIEAGADLNHVSSGFTAEGEAPLHAAAKNGEAEVAKMLLDAGAEPNITTSGIDARTPLHLAAKKNYPKIARLLINAGADTDAHGFNNNTPLHWASEKEMANLLIAAGANVKETAYEDRTPLHSVESGGVAKVLIDAGACVHSTTKGSSQQPLHRVSMHGEPEAVRVLIDSGADPNATDDDGTTPLHYTVKRGKIRNAKTLLQLGADPNIDNEAGETPRDAALDKGEDEIARLLAQQE